MSLKSGIAATNPEAFPDRKITRTKFRNTKW